MWPNFRMQFRAYKLFFYLCILNCLLGHILASSCSDSANQLDQGSAHASAGEEQYCTMPQADEREAITSNKKQKTDTGSPKYKLTYFNYRWLAEPIRLILSYVKEDFEDVRLEGGDSWKLVKPNYRYGFLPELEDLDAGIKLTQSFAIARYLGKKYDLMGANDIEAYKCDEYADCLKDLLKEMETMYNNPDEARKAEMKKNFLNVSVPRYLTVINADIKSNGENHLLASGATWVDFLLAHFTDLFEVVVDKSLLDNYPSVKAHQQRIFNIPDIKKWLAKRPVTEA